MRFKSILLIAFFLVAAQLFSKSTKTQGGASATALFHIYMGHGDQGTETYTVTPKSNKYFLTSTVHLRKYGEPILSQQEQELTSNWSLVRYSLKTTMAKEERTTEASVAGNKIEMRSASGPEVKHKSVDLNPPALAFDSVVPSQFQVLINEYKAFHVQQPLRFQMLAPQVMAEFPGTLAAAGTDKGMLDHHPVELRRYTLMSRGAKLDIWTDNKDQLMRVSLPMRKTEFIRAGFEMAGMPEPVKPEAVKPKSVVMLH